MCSLSNALDGNPPGCLQGERMSKYMLMKRNEHSLTSLGADGSLRIILWIAKTERKSKCNQKEKLFLYINQHAFA